MKNRFYLRSPHGNTGSNMVFHAIDGKDYTSNLDSAHFYTLEEAQAKYNNARDGEHPVSADHVDELAVWKVDHQYIPTTSEFVPFGSTYAAYEKGRYDGNDVFWLNNKTCSTSTDFSKASCLSTAEAMNLGSNYIVIPFCVADEAKRRTFDFSLFNPKTMVQGAGLKTPDHIKKAKRKKDNGKTRWNCPTCGKISWQYNPYDFDGCKDWNCDGAIA